MLDAITRMNEKIKAERILLKPGFMDFDRSQQLHITQHQFLRVLKQLGLMPANQAVYDLIIRKYCNRGTAAEVNYWKFCMDLDKPSDIFPAYVPKIPPPAPKWNQGVHPTQYSPFFASATNELDVINNRWQQPRIEISNDPADVEDRLRSMVVMKRVRIEQFFIDFDKLRKGHVTKKQFYSILSQLNFNFTQEEYDALAAKYETNDPEKFFNYVAFSASINKAFTLPGIDKAPNTRVPAVTQNDTLLARRKYLQTSVNDNSDAMEAVLDEYRRAVQIRRIHLKPTFQDFDRTKNGHVTKLQFLRVLDLLRISASEAVLQELCRKYMDKGNVDEVNYVDFCEDIDGATQLYGVGQEHNHSFDYYPKTRPRVSKAEVVRNMPEDVDDVCARIRRECSQKRIRIGEFFRDFDKLRSGYITNAQFRIGLNLGKLQISNDEFKLLTTHFKAPKEGEHMCWKAFCDHIDEVFTKKELEKSVDISLTDTRTATMYNRRQATPEECAVVQDIVNRFVEVVRKSRLNAKSFFQDFDLHNHFKVSPKIFRQVLTTHGLPLTEQEVELVSLVYGNENYEIEYTKFLADCSEPLTYIINAPYSGAKSTYRAQYTDFDGDKAMQALMHKIKNIIKKDRIRLLEFFQDHDMLRKGVVQPTQFRSTLHAHKVQLTSAEYALLEKHYNVANEANAPLVNYVDFCEEIAKIFTEKDLEKNPTKTLKSFQAPSILDPKDVLDADEEKALHDCMSRLGTHVRHHRLLIKPFFQDKDKSSSGFVSMTRFRSIFDNMKLQASEREFALINKRFQAKAANEINYVEFDWVLRHYSGDLE